MLLRCIVLADINILMRNKVKNILFLIVLADLNLLIMSGSVFILMNGLVMLSYKANFTGPYIIVIIK
jgi:hypothetical protein